MTSLSSERFSIEPLLERTFNEVKFSQNAERFSEQNILISERIFLKPTILPKTVYAYAKFSKEERDTDSYLKKAMAQLVKLIRSTAFEGQNILRASNVEKDKNEFTHLIELAIQENMLLKSVEPYNQLQFSPQQKVGKKTKMAIKQWTIMIDRTAYLYAQMFLNKVHHKNLGRPYSHLKDNLLDYPRRFAVKAEQAAIESIKEAVEEEWKIYIKNFTKSDRDSKKRSIPQ